MVYFPDEDLTDGAAEVASSGFFDVYSAPPWGTWVGYFEDGDTSSGRTYLLAWVPRSIIEAASAGIDVNPEKCIGWLADEDVDLRSILNAIDSSWIR